MNRIRRVLVAGLVSAPWAITAEPAAAMYPLTVVGGSRLMLAATVNGTGVEALLDSAAEVTLLDRTFASALKLAPGTAVRGQGSGAAGFDASLISGVTLGAVGLTLANQTVAIADLSDIGNRLLHRPIKVILGRELFDAARLRIDITAATISVLPRTTVPRGTRLDLISQHGVETIAVRVGGGPPVRATFDLGNGSEVLISKEFAARMKLHGATRPLGRERGGGLGGELSREIVTLSQIELAGHRFKDVVAAIDPQASASDVNIGVKLLRQFRIITDFSQHSIWLERR